MARVSPGPLLSLSLRQPFRNLGLHLATQGVLLAAAALLLLAELLLATGMGEGERSARLLAGQDVGLFPADPASLLLSVLLGVLASLLAVAGLGIGVLVADGIQRGERPTVAEAWRGLGRRLLNLAGTFLLMGVMLGLVMALFVGIASLFGAVVSFVVGFLVSSYLKSLWVLSTPASVLERNSPLRNLGRSIDLGQGQLPLVASATALTILLDALPLALSFAAVSALGAHLAGAEPTLLMDLAMWGAGALLALVGSLVAATFLAGAYRAAAVEPPAQPATPATEAGGPDATP